MTSVNLADAKARLSELVAQAEAGEDICITRRGKPVAQLTKVQAQRRPVALAVLRAVTDTMPMQTIGAGELLRQMRDESRY